MKSNDNIPVPASPLGQLADQLKLAEPGTAIGFYFPTASDRAFFDQCLTKDHRKDTAEEMAYLRRLSASSWRVEIREARENGYEEWRAAQRLPDCWLSRFDYLVRAPLVHDPAVRARYGLTPEPDYQNPHIAYMATSLAAEDAALRALFAADWQPGRNLQLLRPPCVTVLKGQVDDHWRAVWRYFSYRNGLAMIMPIASLLVFQRVHRALPHLGMGRAAAELVRRYAQNADLIDQLNADLPGPRSDMLNSIIGFVAAVEGGDPASN